MQNLLTARQSQELDKRAREKFGIAAPALMENAGCAVAGRAIDAAGSAEADIIIFCGKGNNGGDGFVAARHLLIKGCSISVFLLADINSVRGEAKANLEIFMKMGQAVRQIRDKGGLAGVKDEILKADLVVDAIFGVGLSGSVKEPALSVIDLINRNAKKVLSVDTPSGLNATTGEASNICVEAGETVTFVAPKTGFYKKAGPKHAGRITVSDIGLPLTL